MMKYERLTKSKWTNDNCKPVYDKNGDIVMDKELFDLLITEHNRLAELEDKIEQGTLIDIKTISGLLNEWFECPCNFTLNEEDVALYMFEKYGDWCEKNCDKMLEDYSPCWEMYLKAKLKELQE